MTARVTLNFTKYNTNAAARAFDDRLLHDLASTPGMETSAIASNFPLNNAVSRTQSFIIGGLEGKTADAQPLRAEFTAVSAKYFDALAVPIKRGRAFTTADRDTIAPPVIISQRLAATNWNGRDPIGTRISTDSGRTWNTVVGVAGDVKQAGLDQDVVDEVYYPAEALPPGDIQVLVRFRGSSTSIPATLRKIVHGITRSRRSSVSRPSTKCAPCASRSRG
jgi:hypothetical protein